MLLYAQCRFAKQISMPNALMPPLRSVFRSHCILKSVLEDFKIATGISDKPVCCVIVMQVEGQFRHTREDLYHFIAEQYFDADIGDIQPL